MYPLIHACNARLQWLQAWLDFFPLQVFTWVTLSPFLSLAYCVNMALTEGGHQCSMYLVGVRIIMRMDVCRSDIYEADLFVCGVSV